MKKPLFGKNTNTKPVGLSLVALMDIFTVLVFFLMFNIHDTQSVNVDRIHDLPLSTVALDSLKERKDIAILEIIDRKEVYLNSGKIIVNSNLSQLKDALTILCREQCPSLAIQAPKDMAYPFINKFIDLGNVVGFNGVYLIMRQESN